jgi:hypothetical protein
LLTLRLTICHPEPVEGSASRLLPEYASKC